MSPSGTPSARRGYFVTGTDTGVGKTLVSAALLRRLREEGLTVAGMKPVASGAMRTAAGLRNEDALILSRESSIRWPYATTNPCVYEPAIAPHLAAEAARDSIDFDKIAASFRTMADVSDIIIVEGAGGWRVPLGHGRSMGDLAQRLGLPVLMVVGLRIGCLSHAILTAESIRAQGLHFAGWVASGIDPAFERVSDNLATLRGCLPAPCLGHLPPLGRGGVREAAERLEIDALLATPTPLA
jgi:dethiobiotin synthetase